jgi:hypothetical protein
MEQARFWLRIDGLRAEAEGVIARMRPMLTRQLAQMADEELAGFAHCYRAARDRADCWPLIDAVTVAFGHYDDDAFLAVQHWLICQGEQVYTQILIDPDCILEFLGPDGEGALREAELFGMTIQEQVDIRPGAAKLVEYGPDRAQPYGERSNLGDVDIVHARYPRCSAARERYLNSQLPSIALPEAGSKQATQPTRNLALGATWHPRRR